MKRSTMYTYRYVTGELSWQSHQPKYPHDDNIMQRACACVCVCTVHCLFSLKTKVVVSVQRTRFGLKIFWHRAAKSVFNSNE